jgi:DNA-binding PadR family transcriptional regulator
MNLSEFGRFADPALLILTSLAEGAKHGYAMMEDIEKLSNVRLGPGTLYAALTRLEERGLIEALPAEERRRPYQLTTAGREFLHEQLARWHRLTGIGLERLAGQA